MAGLLTCRAVFGVKGDVCNNILASEEETVIYPAGAYLIKYNGKTKAQESIVPLTGSGLPPSAATGSQVPPLVGSPAGAVAMALSASRRTMAVAERSSSPTELLTISLYQCRTMLKKKVIVVGHDLGVGLDGRAPEVITLAFSPDESMIVLLGGRPNYYIALYSTDKCKLIAKQHLSGLLGVRPAMTASDEESEEASTAQAVTVGHLLADAAAAIGATETLFHAAAASYAASLPASMTDAGLDTSTGPHAPHGHGGHVEQKEVAPPLHMTIAGCTFSTQVPGRVLVHGNGVLAMLAVEDGSESGKPAGMTLLPAHVSVHALAHHAAFNAQAHAQHAAEAATEHIGVAMGLSALQEAAEDAQAAADDAQAAAGEATAAVPDGQNPAESPEWVQRTHEAGDAREAAQVAQAACERVAEHVHAAADGASAKALVEALSTSMDFGCAAWLPPAQGQGTTIEEANGQMAVVATRLGELLLLNNAGVVLGHIEDCPRDDIPIVAVAGWVAQGSLGGFVLGSQAGKLTVYERKAVGGPSSTVGRKGVVGSGARAASAASRASRASSRVPEVADLPALAQEHRLHYVPVKTVTASAPGVEVEVPVTSISVTPSGERAVLALAGTQFLCLDLVNAAYKDDNTAVTVLGPASHSSATSDAIAVGGPASPVSGKNKAAALSKMVSPGAPPTAIPGMSAIISMDIAVRKPVVASVGSDNSVRLWNWVDKTCDLIRTFNESPTAVALHPGGMQLALAFHDRVRLYDVLAEELKELREWPVKGVSEMKFSRGGQFLAAASSTGFVIQVYDTLTGAYLQTLRGHGGRVSSMQWSYNDCTLLSTGADGALYEWSLSEGKRSREALFKGCKFMSANAVKDGSIAYVVGEMPSAGAGGLARQGSSLVQTAPKPTYAIRTVDMGTGLVTAEMPLPERPAGLAMTFTKPAMVFVGAAGMTGDGTSGVLRSLHADPLLTVDAAAVAAQARYEEAKAAEALAKSKGMKDNGSPAEPPAVLYGYGSAVVKGMPACTVVPGAGAGVTKMMLSSDDCQLFVAGQDGSIVVFDVRDSEGRLPVSDFSVKMPWADEVQVTLPDLMEKRAHIKELKDNLAELQAGAEYASRMRDMEFSESVKKLAERSTTDLDGERSHYELLVEEKTDVEREYQDRLSGMDLAHRAEVQKREAMYQSKIMAEVEKYQSLSAEVDSARAHWHHARQSSHHQHSNTMARLTAEYEAKLAAVRENRAILTEEASSARKDWDEMRGQMEGDLDTEVEGLKGSYQGKLDAERDAALKFKGENGIMRKKFASLGKEIEENKEVITQTLTKHSNLRSSIDALEKDISTLRGVIHEKDGVIGEREKRIYELKKKNQELEKFKFVLDVKIKELKGQIEPREAEIAALKKQVREVNSELEAYHKSNSVLDETIGHLRGDIDAMNTRSINGRMYTKRKEAFVANFKADLYRVVQDAKTPEAFKHSLDELIGIYVPKSMPPPTTDLAVVAESERQRGQLDGQLKLLKQSSEAAAVVASKELASLVNENMTLIESARSLKEEIARMRTESRYIRLDMSERARGSSTGMMSSIASGLGLHATASRASLHGGPSASLPPQGPPTGAKPPIGKTLTLPMASAGTRR